MDCETAINTFIKAGAMLIQNGAEIYRVEDTMNRLCLSQPGISNPQSYATVTGLMLSFEYDGKTITRIMRIKEIKTNLYVIDRINHLSRQASAQHMTPEAIAQALDEIEKSPTYPLWMNILCGGLGALGFCIFFGGNWQELLASFSIGLVIRTMFLLMSDTPMNSILINIAASFTAALLAVFVHHFVPEAQTSNMVISSIMLLAPGLAMTNAIRDTVSGDYVAGLARGLEAFLTATAIAIGCGIVLILW